jgi:hypothetical protein
LTVEEIAIVRKSFPRFMPETFAPGTNPANRSALTLSNFAPALFFGPAQPDVLKLTPSGIRFQANGFDGPSVPDVLETQATYFNPSHGSLQLILDTFALSPLNKIEQRMQLPLSPSAPLVFIDRTRLRVNAAEIDQIMNTVRAALAGPLPSVAGVDLSRCEVVVEPAISYVYGSNFGNVWAVGLTERLGGGYFRIHVCLFYISSQGVLIDWRAVLVDEALNFFVLSIGRDDLAL